MDDIAGFDDAAESAAKAAITLGGHEIELPKVTPRYIITLAEALDGDTDGLSGVVVQATAVIAAALKAAGADLDINELEITLPELTVAAHRVLCAAGFRTEPRL